jgi:GR25 family glycosyltransferase involved in LPS biosynthesis
MHPVPSRHAIASLHEPSIVTVGELPIFVISLERRADRRGYMRAQLERHGLTGTFVTAVDGLTLDLSAYPACPPWGRVGNLGNTFSHRAVWRQVVERSLPAAIVLEDDAALQEGFRARLDQVLAEITFLFDLIYLGSLHPPDVPRLTTNLAPAPRAFCTHAYLISAAGAVKLLDFIEPTWWPIDNQIAEETRLVKYLVHPNLANQAGFSSDIA